MFSHHPSIHHFTLNDPPSPKSKRQVIHIEDEGDRTPTQEFGDPFNKENKVSFGFYTGIIHPSIPSFPHIYTFFLHHNTPHPSHTSTQHLYAPAADVAPHHTLVIPSFVVDPSKPPSHTTPKMSAVPPLIMN
jgi:hypothetical protein